MSVIEHFTKAAGAYDDNNRQLSAISENMHFLIRLILKDAPTQARVLCVGVGTGAEIFSLANAYPQWTFVGVDPSIGMLDVCRDKLRSAGILNRCELIQGYVDDVPREERFDVVLSVLVAHFVKQEDRLAFYKAMVDRLRENGVLVNTEISFDLDSQEFPLMLENWKSVQQLMGAAPESLVNLPQMLREALAVIAPEKTEEFIKESGIKIPVRFFQAFMIHGWFGHKR